MHPPRPLDHARDRWFDPTMSRFAPRCVAWTVGPHADRRRGRSPSRRRANRLSTRRPIWRAGARRRPSCTARAWTSTTASRPGRSCTTGRNDRSRRAVLREDCGITVDWRTYSLADLRDSNGRCARAAALARFGIKVDWKTYTLQQLDDLRAFLQQIRAPERGSASPILPADLPPGFDPDAIIMPSTLGSDGRHDARSGAGTSDAPAAPASGVARKRPSIGVSGHPLPPDRRLMTTGPVAPREPRPLAPAPASPSVAVRPSAPARPTREPARSAPELAPAPITTTPVPRPRAPAAAAPPPRRAAPPRGPRPPPRPSQSRSSPGRAAARPRPPRPEPEPAPIVARAAPPRGPAAAPEPEPAPIVAEPRRRVTVAAPLVAAPPVAARASEARRAHPKVLGPASKSTADRSSPCALRRAAVGRARAGTDRRAGDEGKGRARTA